MQKSLIHKILDDTGHLNGVHIENISLAEPFIDMAARFADTPGSVVLMSGGTHDSARYHILGIDPWLTLTSRHDSIEVKTSTKVHRLRCNPFDVLKTLCHAYALKADKCLPSPFACGLLGYLAYDLKDFIEKLPRTSIDDLGLPGLVLYAPSLLAVHDKTSGSTCLITPRLAGTDPNEAEQTITAFKDRIAGPPPSLQGFGGNRDGFKSNFEKAAYLDSVDRIKTYIGAGHVYQVNLSQRFRMGFQGNGYTLFRTLYGMNPAPFYAYINAGDHQIVSTSPERFLRQTGRQVETRPIKGTRPRGTTPEQDENLRHALQASPKDDAELSMIVDLLRNDMGKVCKAGTVAVTAHKRLETYQNVYHLVSVVKGTLDDHFDAVDLIRATFPGGSITGCPKIRSMEIIDELEPHRRHIYTGSIGYIGFDNTMDLSIAIRTATIVDDQIFFSVGGGIVYDSDPQSEFEETLHKGQTLIKVFKGKQGSRSPLSYAWHNGQIKSLSRTTVPVDDLGFQYGFGFFETLRVNRGLPHNLEAHVTRFNHAWRELFLTEPPDLTWDVIIEQVIAANSLQHVIAAVKIMAAMGPDHRLPRTTSLFVLARPYTHRNADRKIAGLHLATYPEARQTPLARHKTLNYLYYHLAGQWAHNQGCDEALILNPDGTISETNSASILMVQDRRVVRPVSSNALPGTMEKLVCDWFAGRHYDITTRSIMPEALSDGVQVLVMNSLMGVLPVLSVDNRRLASPSNLWRQINDAIF